MIEKTTLRGLTAMTSIMAFCATEKTSVNGAHRIR